MGNDFEDLEPDSEASTTRLVKAQLPGIGHERAFPASKTALGTPLNLSIAEDAVIEAAAVLRGRSSGPRSAASGGFERD